MALLFDDVELRDKRIANLLSTALSLQQLKQQKDIANQNSSLRRDALVNQLKANKNRSQVDFAKLGYSAINPQDQARVQNEQNMISNPNRGQIMQDNYGQSFQPNQRLMDRANKGGGTPRFIQDDNGNFIQLPGILVETPQQKSDRKMGTATADQQNQLQANQNASLVFQQLQQMGKGLESIGGLEGIAVKGGNVVTRGALNPQAQAYADFMPAAAVNLYRGITGDTRLSDYDAKRAYSIVWDISQDGAVKGIKDKNISNLLEARNILLSNNVYTNKKDEKITSLSDVMFVANAVERGASQEQIISFLKAKRKK